MAAKKKTSKKKAKKKAAKKKATSNSAGIPRGQGRKKAKKKGGAPKGNQFWKMRSTHGRKPIFEHPDQLLDACIQFIKWCEENPLYEHKMTSTGKIAKVPKMRALTMEGLYIFVDIDRTTWAEYREKEDFTSVTRWVEGYMHQQKFTGAAAGFLNANIIARDLGLKDSSEVTTPIGRPFEVTGQILFTPAKLEDD